MAVHSSNFPWKTPWTEEPGGLQSIESQRVGHNWVTKKQQQQNVHLLNCKYWNSDSKFFQLLSFLILEMSIKKDTTFKK